MTNREFASLWLCFKRSVADSREYLNALDAAIGDADHGTNLQRGLDKVAAERAAWGELTLDASCQRIAMTLLSTVGGASGALWGSGLLKSAAVLPNALWCDEATVAAAIGRFVGSVAERGKAVIGDKTMLDVFLPALHELEAGLARGQPFSQVVRQIAADAGNWARDTAALQAKRGRAAYLGPRSVGHIDPGAWSSALWWRCLADSAGGGS
ncbi:MAG: dihydroxyacetone kinase subunit DhaL [Thermaerobacter sp.]|nr:dihydroxyacetone kinase subunit DhaL [Thermaerobacter sp.]